MSTRCHIQIKRANGEIYPCMIYKHADGYPEAPNGVLGWLPQIVEKFFKYHGDDAEYCLAQILRQAAIQDIEQGYSWAKDFLGWGVCLTTEPHGDAVFIYTVDLKDGKVSYRRA